MKEFSAQTGGRYTYVDDIVNLQELSLAFASIFSECDNFIVSGCNITGTSISPGYIYLNGKIRHFSGTTGITVWPQFIYESNRAESVAYASGADKVGRNVYACAISKTVPTALDPLTGAIPTYIKLMSNGGLRMKEALFGRYSLLLQPESGTQTVSGTVNFSNDVNVAGEITAKGRVSISQGNAAGKIYYENGKLYIQSRIGSGKIYQIAISEDDGFQFIVNNTPLFSMANGQCKFSAPILANEATIANIAVTNNHIFNTGVSSDSGVLRINFLSFQGGSSYYRDTVIGNGKGVAVVSIKGSSGEVGINGTLTLKSPSNNGLVLQGDLQKNNVALRKVIDWRDSGSVSIGSVGYNSISDNVFRIINNIADVHIAGITAVDLGPAIKENGELLSKKYVTSKALEDILKGKSDSNSVYTIAKADQTFSTKSGGLIQFVSDTKTKESLRSEIGALSADDLVGKYPLMSNLLSDMAATDSEKKQICENIGAARVGSFQPVLKDTGWVKIGDNLYARQVGAVVCIQGRIITIHSGIVFTLPNSIDPPRYEVAFRAAMDTDTNWGCKIIGGSKQCRVVYCNKHGRVTTCSMTYMV